MLFRMCVSNLIDLRRLKHPLYFNKLKFVDFNLIGQGSVTDLFKIAYLLFSFANESSSGSEEFKLIKIGELISIP